LIGGCIDEENHSFGAVREVNLLVL